jgi:hypothetical protein
MSHFKEINETSIKQLQITHVELKLYSDACSEPTRSGAQTTTLNQIKTSKPRNPSQRKIILFLNL